MRDRKMYVFRHPFSIDPSFLGRISLIVPSEWGLADSRLSLVKKITKTVASKRLRSYEVDLLASSVKTTYEPNPRAAQMSEFDIFEHVQ